MKVKNNVVKMDDWEVEGFFESKKDGFIAAVKIYETSKGSMPVMFKDGKAFMLYDEDTQAPATRTELSRVLKSSVDEYGPDCVFEDLFEDIYIEVSNGVAIEEDVAEMYGFSEEQCTNILDSIDDLSGYTETSWTDM